MEQSFEALTQDIISHPRFARLRDFVHHGEQNSVFVHSVCVAHTAYRMGCRLHLPEQELRSVTRAALLHDFFGYDWHGDRFRRFQTRHTGLRKFTRMHAFVHGPIAAERARKIFGISPKECEAIARHMFPLAAMPRTRIAWIVTMADKYVATREVSAAVGNYLSALYRKVNA